MMPKKIFIITLLSASFSAISDPLDFFVKWTELNKLSLDLVTYAIRPENNKSASRRDKKTAPVYTFDSIAGAIPDDVKEIVDSINNPEQYTQLGIEPPKGILFYGPSGTGKTSLARAIASEAKAAFFHRSAASFVEIWVGNGPKHVRELFDEARHAIESGEHTKAILFIDEIDAVGSMRGGFTGGGDSERHNTLNELLQQMDGFAQNPSIIVIGATNRIEDIDKALLRPGRFDRLVEIPLPNTTSRQAIIELYAKKLKLDASEKLFQALAQKTTGYSAAELKGMVQEAALFAKRAKASAVTDAHFALALQKTMAQKKFRKNESLEIRPQEVLDKFIFAYGDDVPPQAAMSFIKKKTESWVTFHIDFTTKIGSSKE